MNTPTDSKLFSHSAGLILAICTVTTLLAAVGGVFDHESFARVSGPAAAVIAQTHSGTTKGSASNPG